MNALGKSFLCLAAFFAVIFGERSGVKAEDQMFRVRPESVEVRSGADVFLRCVVENQQGNAQWTKDGFALGFERHVPGYPRYSYSGDPSKGEHHLIIKGVTLEDDGEYQCQVGPTMKTSAIWSAANVTVMVSPANVSLVGIEPGSTVEKVVGSSLQLQCLVSDARPAPSVAWYRDGLLLDQGLQEDRIKSSSHPRLLSVVSRLTVKVTKADDGQQYSCRALHPTLRDSRASLITSVILSVLHPPGDPVITGYKTGEVLHAGDKRTLNCRVMGGNPRPWLAWYWHGWDAEGVRGGRRWP
ncbi:nephrin-like [Macrobrachium rosenbergii]|uniref:nephrin-like n=1 Tax=Macrobrachium rosenbergii TaxID=79674 RepID=UPI0034D64C1E